MLKLTPPLRYRLQSRIRKNVTIDADTGCWLWKLRKNNSGYGVVSVRLKGYVHPVKLFAHRLSYAVFKRMPPRNRQIAHSFRCVGPSCCNPEHLRATTQSANERDKKRAAAWRRRKKKLREVFPPTHLQEPLREAA